MRRAGVDTMHGVRRGVGALARRVAARPGADRLAAGGWGLADCLKGHFLLEECPAQSIS